jgi:STE24 endopeptidase
MPLTLLIALFLAYGIDTSFDSGSLARTGVVYRVGEVLGLVGLVTGAAFLLGRIVASRLGRGGRPTPSLRRRYAWGTRAVDLAMLVSYGVIIHELAWPSVVWWGFGVRGIPIADDALVLLPFLLMQFGVWWGLFPAERAFRASLAIGRPISLSSHLIRRGRQTMGLVLPALILFSLGQDLARRVWPNWTSATWSQPVEVALMGVAILVLSPAFVRLAWPTRSLPPGPLRDRLEHLSARFGFRCSDILIWDTGQGLVNAGVTGAIPWFRYVILTDALVDFLDPFEIAAVFGHEIGHIAHRHLPYFGFFFVASLGLLGPLGRLAENGLVMVAGRASGGDSSVVVTVIEAATALVAFGLYILVVFGHVSRRFERQADLFGCRAVSCGQSDCPPHADLDRSAQPGVASPAPCPVGIRIFANALSSVAALNDIEPTSRSWRHGSIARRIAFLEGLEGKPEAVQRFEAGVFRLRVGLAFTLITLLLAALALGGISPL